MSKRTIYLVVKLELQRDVNITEEDVFDIVNELDYEFTSNDTNVTVCGTELLATHTEFNEGLL
jgi:hypothetical protein